MQRELPADAGARPGAERLEGVRGPGPYGGGLEPVRVEPFRIRSPHLGIPVEHRGEDERPRAAPHRVLLREHGVLACLAGEGGGGRPEPQRLVEHPAYIAQPGDLGVVGPGGVAPHRVDLGAGAGGDLRVQGEVVQGEGEGAGGGLVSGDEEGDDLAAHVVRGEPFAGLRVRGLQHPVEQVTVAVAAGAASGGDHGVDRAVEQRDVVLVAAGGGAQEQRGERSGDGVAALGVGEGAHHGGDEGVRAGAFERAEVVAEAGAGDRLQRQLGHVGGHVDGAARRLLQVPAVDQPFGDVQHHRVVAAHRLPAEPGGEHVVRELPVRLVVVGGEQPVPGDGAQIGHAEADVLGEA